MAPSSRPAEQEEQEQEEQEQEEQEQEQEQEPAGKGEVRVYAGLCWFSTVFVLFRAVSVLKVMKMRKGEGNRWPLPILRRRLFIQGSEFCIQNHEFCIQNDEFCI